MPARPSLAAEFRTAIRAISRRPATSLILIATIGLGIGASTAIFTVVDAVLLRPLPFREPTRLANVWALESNGFSHPQIDREVAEFWRERTTIFSQVESFNDRGMLYTGADEPSDVRVTFASKGLFALLGIPAAIGRTLLADDAAADAPNVAVVSDEFYRTQLGSRREAIGRALTLDGRPYLVVGVMPAWFRYPLGNVAMWVPLKPGSLTENEQRSTSMVARIRPDLTPEAAAERVRQSTAQLQASNPRPNGWAVSLFFLGHNSVNRDVQTTLWILAGAVLCLLLISCANAANILLVRATARQQELSIRSALGATRASLVRQLVTESLVLALLGGLAGVVIAYWGVDLLMLILPREMAFLSYTSISVDTRVLVFAIAASIVTGLLFGVGPAVRASRAHGTFLIQSRSGTPTRAMSTVRGALIVAEVALSLMLLVGAGLFARSFAILNDVNPGFDVERIVSTELMLSSLRYPTPDQRTAVVQQYKQALRAIPGVVGVSVASGAPPRAGVSFADRLEAEGIAPPTKSDFVTIPYAEGDTEYFSLLGIRMVQGRAFTEDDRRATDRRAVIDPDLARSLWPDGNALGRRFRLGPDDPWTTVVGVASEVKLMGPDDSAGKFGIYYPDKAGGRRSRYAELVIRTTGDPRRAIQPIKRAIWSIDPQQPISAVTLATDALSDSLAKPRFLLTLMGVFAGVALALAVIGLYGVLSHAVAQRTREIGIRMALGAQASNVLRGVLGYGGVLTVFGVALGLGLALAGGKLVRTLLFGIEPLDPVSMVLAAATLTVAALAACYIPARRATKVDPLVALRSD